MVLCWEASSLHHLKEATFTKEPVASVQELVEAEREERRQKKEAEQKKKEEMDARLAQQQQAQDSTDGCVAPLKNSSLLEPACIDRADCINFPVGPSSMTCSCHLIPDNGEV